MNEIGREILFALRNEGFNVRGWSRSPKQLDDVETHTGSDGLTSMVGRCAIIINVLPLTEETRHILCRGLFAHFSNGNGALARGRSVSNGSHATARCIKGNQGQIHVFVSRRRFLDGANCANKPRWKQF